MIVLNISSTNYNYELYISKYKLYNYKYDNSEYKHDNYKYKHDKLQNGHAIRFKWNHHSPTLIGTTISARYSASTNGCLLLPI